MSALPAGDRLAYIGTDGNLWLLNTKGPLRKITNDGHAAAPQWTNNGEVLRYEEGTAGGVVEKAWDYPSGGPDAQLGGVSQDGRLIRVAPKTGASIGGVFSVPVAGGEPVYHGSMLHTWSLLDWFPGGHRFAFTLGEGRICTGASESR